MDELRGGGEQRLVQLVPGNAISGSEGGSRGESVLRGEGMWRGEGVLEGVC